MTAKIFVNGRMVAAGVGAISPTDRGFTLGDGVFETMLALDGTVVRLDAHMARLSAGAERLHIPVDISAARAAIAETLAANGLAQSFATVRLTLTRGTGARGLSLPTAPRPTLVVSASGYTPYPAELYRHGMKAIILPYRKNEFSALVGVKSLNYAENILGKADAQTAGADEGIFLNTRGFLAEGCVSNLFWVQDERLFTPEIACGAVAGVVRAAVLEVAESAGIATEVGKYNASSLFASDEAFFTNSLIGIMPLTAVDGRAIGRGKPGKLTQFLAQNLTPQMPMRPAA